MSSDSFTQQYLVIFAHMIKCNDVNETLFFFFLMEWCETNISCMSKVDFPFFFFSSFLPLLPLYVCNLP